MTAPQGRRPDQPPPVLCVQFQPSAPLGVGRTVFEEHKFPYVTIEVWKTQELPDVTRFSGLIILGGEMHAHDVDDYPFLQPVTDLTRRAVDEEVPVFGICLGGQILATAMGSRVRRSSKKEVGFHRLIPTNAGRADEILSVFASDVPVFQFHEDTFDLPDGAELLLSTEAVPNQAFRVGDRAFGVQFHPEVTRTEVVAWSDLAGGDDVLKPQWGVTIGELLSQATLYLERSQHAGREAFRRFLALVESAAAGDDPR